MAGLSVCYSIPVSLGEVKIASNPDKGIFISDRDFTLKKG